MLCGYYLNQIKKRGLYLYCVETGLQGYTNFFKFCEDKLGVPTTTAQRLILINDRFCGGTHTLPDKFYKYGSSKLALMATFQNGLEGKIAPVTSVKDIEKLHKFYASHGWNVDLETTWKDDLETYRREEVEKRKAKRARLNKPFESVRTEAEKTREKIPRGFYTYTKFLDQTINRLKDLFPPEGDAFEEPMKRVLDVLKDVQSELLYRQSGDMLEGL